MDTASPLYFLLYMFGIWKSATLFFFFPVVIKTNIMPPLESLEQTLDDISQVY